MEILCHHTHRHVNKRHVVLIKQIKEHKDTRESHLKLWECVLDFLHMYAYTNTYIAGAVTSISGGDKINTHTERYTARRHHLCCIHLL